MATPLRKLAILLTSLLVSVSVLQAQRTSVPDQPLVPEGGGRSDSSFVPTLQYVEASDDLTLDDTDLSGTPSTQIGMLPRSGTLGLNYCNDLSIHSGTLRITLDLGDDYNYGTTSFSVSTSLRIEGVDTDPGGGTLLIHDPVSLSIDQDAPEQVYYISYSGTDLTDHDLVDEYRVILNSYSVSGSVTSDVRVTVRYDDEYAVDPIRVSPDQDEPIIYQDPAGGVINAEVTDNPVPFEWHNASGCGDEFPAYQLQILRLFNTEPSYDDDVEQVKATVNWKEAMTIETDGTAQEVKLTIAQGTGWYLWRARPIGSIFPGGSGDSRNWGVWTRAPENGDVLDFDGLTDGDIDTFAFFYRQFEDTLNWIYSRGFTEGPDGDGSRIGEGMTFMTRGGRPVQSQARESETGQYHVTNGVVDFQGRSTLGFMSAPTGDSTQGFFFRPNFTKTGSESYRAKHFDDDGNFDDPDQLTGANTLQSYWDGTETAEGGEIPDADGYPFSRVLLSTDGSGRPYEIGGVGETYRLAGGAGGQARTTRIYYASASDRELLRLFGDEAPADTSVYKMMVTGPNKVTSISWIYGGRTIATALKVGQGDTLMVDLADASEPTMSGSLVDTLRANRTRGASGFSTGKRYAFTDTTEVTIRYELTPDTITASALCVDTCTTCDYFVRLYVHPIDSDFPLIDEVPLSDPVVIEHVLGGDPCGEGSTIDTTVTVTFPPGTYYIERRLETGVIDPATINPTSTPYGVTYAKQFRDIVAGGIREKMLTDDSVSAVLDYLSTNDLQGLYEYLDLNLDSLSTYGYDTLTTECCEVIFPILSPDCGFNPCQDSTPDFEAYLFEKWGDEHGYDLNDYFQFDGDQDIWPTAGRPDSAFNQLIANMLDDTDTNNVPLYSCGQLWSIWVGLVDAWEQLSDDPDNPGNFNPDFNMLDVFLQAAGVYWVDTSHTAYDADNGYLLWAHRYVNKDVLTTECKDLTGYNTGWHGDPPQADSASHWKEIYACRQGANRQNRNKRVKYFGATCDLSDILDGMGGRLDWDTMGVEHRQDSCWAHTAQGIEDQCLSRCEQRREEFAWGIVRAYQDSGITLCYEDALCMADAVVDSCLSECNLTLFESNGHIDSIGTIAELEAIDRVITWRVEFAVPVDDGMGGQYCANDTMVLYEGLVRPFSEDLVRILNANIHDWVRNYGGNFFNIKEALRECSADSLVDLVTDSIIFLPTFDFYGDTTFVRPYFELRDSCELWYVCDTIDWSTLYPEREHPMVENLNAFLDGFWGMEIDSSVTGTFDCELDPLDSAYIRDYAFQANTADLYTDYIDSEILFVKGVVGPVPVSDYVDFTTQKERTMYWSSELTRRLIGDFLIQGTNGNTDEVWFTTYADCGPLLSGNEKFLDFEHGMLTGAGCSTDHIYRSTYEDTFSGDTTGRGLPHVGLQPGSPYGSGNNTQKIYDAVREPYTSLIGKFARTAEDSLIYISLNWGGLDLPGADTCAVFGVKFYGVPTKKLSDSVCTDKSCPDICWRWFDPEPDTAGATLIGPPPCDETATRRIRGAIDGSIRRCIDGALADLKDEYDAVCGTPENLNESIVITQAFSYTHFTLYYYDRAGRLVRTIPPKGVDVLSTAEIDGMTNPHHNHATRYDYNSLGQLIATQSIDGGLTEFWYDRLGRLRFSQDARLRALNEYAYTKFDELGRVVETGISSDSITADGFLADSNIGNRLFPYNGTERTYIAYDTSSGMNYLPPAADPQKYLRNRVSRTWTDDDAETHYSYDVHGNIEWVAQVVPGFPLTNYLKYDYDLISGNVNEVIYNEGRVDEFRHRYSYDRDNALTEVETSYDGVVWDSDARYEYYPHGALRRVELGEDKLQGLDLTYTVQGQLKAINERSLTQGDDPGEDGAGTYGHAAYAADSFALVMNYHENDFSSQAGTFNSGGADDLIGLPQYDGNISSVEINVGKTTGTGVYEELTGTSYRYDVLGRLDSSRFHTYNSGTDEWNAFGQEYLTTYEYDANGNIKKLIRHAEDAGGGATQLDSLTYQYEPGVTNRVDYIIEAVAGDPHTEDIENTQSIGNYEYDAIGNLIQDVDEGNMTLEWDAYGKVKGVSRTFPGSVTQQIDYTYDAGGNRVKKRVQQWSLGSWEETETYYMHDAGGVVVAIYEKDCDAVEVVPPGGGPDADMDGWADTVDNCPGIYNPGQRDSDGDGVGDSCDICVCEVNPLQQDNDNDGVGNQCDSIFGIPPIPPVNDADQDGWANDHDNCPCTENPEQEDTDFDGYGDSCDVCDYRLVELPIYGSGRVGVARPDISIFDAPNTGPVYTRELGEKHYELTDHLGNVRAVLGDRKLTSTPGAGNYYADVEAYTHQYPFGMPQPGRTWDGSSLAYRYGFNGMETDPEVKGESGNHYTTYFRQYDPRVGRWWSRDPVTHPRESPYVAFHNNPALLADPLGNDPPPDCPECRKAYPNPVENQPFTTSDGSQWKYSGGEWNRIKMAAGSELGNSSFLGVQRIWGGGASGSSGSAGSALGSAATGAAGGRGSRSSVGSALGSGATQATSGGAAEVGPGPTMSRGDPSVFAPSWAEETYDFLTGPAGFQVMSSGGGGQLGAFGVQGLLRGGNGLAVFGTSIVNDIDHRFDPPETLLEAEMDPANTGYDLFGREVRGNELFYAKLEGGSMLLPFAARGFSFVGGRLSQAYGYRGIVEGSTALMVAAEDAVVATMDDVVRASVSEGVNIEGAVWAQNTFNSTFSVEGKFAGQTIDDVVAALRNGELSAVDITIDVVVRDGQTFILNTRSSAALMRAGIPRSSWNVIDKTGNSFFENLLTDQLARNSLINGTDAIRQSGTQLILTR